MAKKSAKSKGFRKQQTKKPYLSKREIAVLCVAAVLLVIVAIVAANYNDGALKVKDGAIVDAGENWLIVNGSGARARARYFKVGELGDIEGYARENVPVADANVPRYLLTPEAEDAGIDTLSITANHNAAKAMAEYVYKVVSAIDGNEAVAPATAEAGGVSYTYLSSVSDLNAGREDAEAQAEPAAEDAAEPEAESEESADSAEAEEKPAAANYSETFYAYVDCARESCVVIDVNASAETREELPDEAAMRAVVEQAIAALTLEDAK